MPISLSILPTKLSMTMGTLYLAEGEAKKSRETAIKMLKKQKPLSEIKEFTDMSEEEIVRLAKENGLEVIDG